MSHCEGMVKELFQCILYCFSYIILEESKPLLNTGNKLRALSESQFRIEKVKQKGLQTVFN
jgi:hypothetical protein